MTEVTRIAAGTKVVQGEDGKWFPVDEDDPRGKYFLIHDLDMVNGEQAKPVFSHPVIGEMNDKVRQQLENLF